MFRSIVRAVPRTPIFITPIRLTALSQFHTTPITFSQKRKQKKNGKSEHAAESTTDTHTESPTIDLTKANEKFNNVLEKFSKSATSIKLGKSDARIFDKLEININNEFVPFTSIASTSIKGRHFIITLFDPSYGKHIISSLIDSDLNMSGQIDPNNKFSLKVPLPSITTETKQEQVKQLKEAFEKVKNGSLAGVRSDVRSKFLKDAKSSRLGDSEQAVLDEFEKLHKSYIDKLTNIFKTTQSAILK
ncbi:Ribosome-recycling factor mitochondrial [Spathaspora sp. JA1]|nr:Ribosome-recycling factor mitochondrial [Spathaspora sp. JA1]